MVAMPLSRILSIGITLLMLLVAPATFGQAPTGGSAALQAARGAALRSPRSVPLQITLAETALAEFRDDEALRAAATANSLAPANVQVQSLLAKTLLRSGRYDEGLKLFADLPDEERRRYDLPGAVKAAEMMLNVEMLQEQALDTQTPDDDRQVSNSLRVAIETAPDMLVIQKALADWYLDKLRQPQNALPVLEALMKRAPHDIDAKRMLALSTLQLGRFDQANKLYKQLLQGLPDDIELKIGEALSQVGLGEREAGLETLRDLLRAEPDNAAIIKALADAQRSGAVVNDLHDPDAIDLFEQAQELLQAAGSEPNMRDYSAAVRLLEEALVIEPESVEIRKSLGYLYLEKLNRANAAYNHLAEANRIKPDDLSVLKLLGLAALNSGRQCEAIEFLDLALERDPQDLWIRVNLGRAYARGGCYRIAMDLYCEVLAQEPNNFTARLGVAEVQAWRGHSREPIAITEQLVEERPTNEEAHNLLGDLYRWDYDLDLAKYEYGSILERNPNHEAANDGLYEIDKTLSDVATVDAYQFADNSGFDRRFVSAALRVPLTNKAYLTPRGTEWRFKQGPIKLDRSEAILDLEYNFNRQWQATGRFLNYDYSNRDSQQAGNMTIKYTPLATVDMYFSASANEPAFLTDIGIPLANIRMNNFGYGFDINLADQWSTQGSVTYADYSDSNIRRFGMAQLSYQHNPCYDIFLRLQYEDLSFTDQTFVYFSPANFELMRFIADIDFPITDTLDVLGKFDAIEVFGQGEGYLAKIGPRWRPNDRIELRASYFNISVPGAAPFTGDGFEAFGSIRF